MKELDFVKLTLWLAGALTLALAVLFFVYGSKIRRIDAEIAAVEKDCTEVGRLSKDIKILEEEKRHDNTPSDSTNTNGILSYFSQWAKRHGIDPGQDYLFKSREPQPNRKGGWVDQEFTINFKKEQPKKRDLLIAFLFDCESQSRRIKLSKARLMLAEENAESDRWNADLTFVRRDPTSKAAE